MHSYELPHASLQVARMNPTRIALVCAILVLGARANCQVQVPHADVITGRVTTDSGVAIQGASIIATMAPNRELFQTASDSAGNYALKISNGTGDYLVHIGAVGRVGSRRRITRGAASDSVFHVDASLRSAAPVRLAAVRVRAANPLPQRGRDIQPSPGGGETVVDGVLGVLPPDLSGDIASIAAQTPGIIGTPDGFSALGLPSAQNSTTLNGLAFGGADIPRDLPVISRVATSSFDPAIGWFSGGNVDIDVQPGSIFATRTGHVTADSPHLQTRESFPSTSSGISRLDASMGGSGGITDDDKYFYSYGVQAGRASRSSMPLSNAGPFLLKQLGISSDSVSRLLGAVAAAGIPEPERSAPDYRVTQNVLAIARIDHTPFDWENLKPSPTHEAITAYARMVDDDGAGLSPLSTISATGRSLGRAFVLQGLLSHYFNNQFLADTKTALSYSRNVTSPYLRIPASQVLLRSTGTNGTGGADLVNVGADPSLSNDRRAISWETSQELQFYLNHRSNHRIKLTADAKLDHFARASPDADLGAFYFASLSDFVANQPASFTRTVGGLSSSSSEWSSFAAASDTWSPNSRLQVQYGMRGEVNRFLTTPAYDANVFRQLGVLTNRLPNTWGVSPRLGFTWLLGNNDGTTALSRFGPVYRGPTAALRGGIGLFRGALAPTLVSGTTAQEVGRAGQLTCLAASAPSPEWAKYAANPSSIPVQCVEPESTAFSDLQPDIHYFKPGYTAPQSWRANLGYSRGFARLLWSVDATYSLNVRQPGVIDANLLRLPQFLAGGEHRPVYASVGAIDPRTGALSAATSRADSSFGRVITSVSDTRSIAKLLTLTVQPDFRVIGFNRWIGSASYSLASSHVQQRGFDGTTFGDPAELSWSRSALDVRDRILLRAGYATPAARVVLYASFMSGLPFTPIVRGDVNGDGLANDRAFVFDPAHTIDSSVANGMRLLMADSRRARMCLASQLGHAADTNGCDGPWSIQMNTQLSLTGAALHLPERVAAVTLNLANPAAVLDELLHGSNSLRGWGGASQPDPTLLSVVGFDPSAQAFKYTVNPHFGQTSPALARLTAPFRITLDVSIDLGHSWEEQQLERALRPGRRGHAGARLTEQQLLTNYSRAVPDPYAALLQQSDSLLLSRDQVDELAQAHVAYRVRIDSVLAPLTKRFAAIGDQFNTDEELKLQNSVIDSAWDMTRADVQAQFARILSPIQLRLLPSWAWRFYNAAAPMRAPRLTISR